MIEAPGSPIAVRIGEPNTAVDLLIDRFGADEWAFITAYNPYSEVLSAEENQSRHRRLLETIRDRNLVSFESHGVDDDGTWPSERGLFVAGLSRDEAVELGRELDQNAIVVGARGGAPELVWCIADSPR